MNPLLISLLVFALIFGGALVGVFVRPLLSEEHLHPDSKDIVKMATGLIGTAGRTCAWSVIASAKSSFDQKTSQVQANDRHHHPSGRSACAVWSRSSACRNLLRRSIQPLANRIWQEEESKSGKLVHFESSAEAWAFENVLETPVAER